MNVLGITGDYVQIPCNISTWKRFSGEKKNEELQMIGNQWHLYIFATISCYKISKGQAKNYIHISSTSSDVGLSD